MIRATVAALVLSLAATLAGAQVATHNAELSIAASDPTGTCSDGRLWINSTTGDGFVCYGRAWNPYGSPVGATFPLLGPTGCAAPAYSFADDPKAGLCRENIYGTIFTHGTGTFPGANVSLVQLNTGSAGIGVNDGLGFFDGISISEASRQIRFFHASSELARFDTPGLVVNTPLIVNGSGLVFSDAIGTFGTNELIYARGNHGATRTVTLTADFPGDVLHDLDSGTFRYLDPVGIPYGTSAQKAIFLDTNRDLGCYGFTGTNYFECSSADSGEDRGQWIINASGTTSIVSEQAAGAATRASVIANSGNDTVTLTVDNTARVTVHTLGLSLTTAQTLAQLNAGVKFGGDIAYCSDCIHASPCASGGSGAVARYENSVWNCSSEAAPAYGELRISTPAGTNTTSGTPVKAQGTTTLGSASEFDMPANNRLRYTGTATKVFSCAASLSLTSTSNNFVASIFLSDTGTVDTDSEIQRFIGTGSDVGAAGTHGLETLSTNDYVELFLDSAAGNPQVTVEFMTLTCTEV